MQTLLAEIGAIEITAIREKPIHEVIIDMLILYGFAERHQIVEKAFKDECDKWVANFKNYDFISPHSVIDDGSTEG